MASYIELRALSSDSDLKNKVQTAITIAANDIFRGDDDTDPPYSQAAGDHDLRVKWAESAIGDLDNLFKSEAVPLTTKYDRLLTFVPNTHPPQ